MACLPALLSPSTHLEHVVNAAQVHIECRLKLNLLLISAEDGNIINANCAPVLAARLGISISVQLQNQFSHGDK